MGEILQGDTSHKLKGEILATPLMRELANKL